jgi:hypothetical protein
MRVLIASVFAGALLAPEPATVDVAVAARDLYQGVKVTEQDVAAVSFPAELVPPGALTVADVVGLVPRERVLRNEIVRRERLADPLTGQGLHVTIPPGMRVLAVQLDPERPAEPPLEAGSIIDLEQRDGLRVGCGVPVLALLDGGRAMALAVTPREAEQIADAALEPLVIWNRFESRTCGYAPFDDVLLAD